MKDSPLSVEDAIRWRRAVRDFAPRPVAERDLAAILDDARRAPSGYNLQPTHFVVVRGGAREALARAALGQRQVREAPLTVVLAADVRAHRSHAEEVSRMDREAGAVDEDYDAFLRRMVRLGFRRGPLGLGGPLKGVLGAVLGAFRPMPRFPAAHPREWALKQALLAGGFLLLAAASRGLASCPMEGFDERRVRRVIAAPRSFAIPLIVPLGHPADTAAPPRRTRLPLARLAHDGTWDRAFSTNPPAP